MLKSCGALLFCLAIILQSVVGTLSAEKSYLAVDCAGKPLSRCWESECRCESWVISLGKQDGGTWGSYTRTTLEAARAEFERNRRDEENFARSIDKPVSALIQNHLYPGEPVCHVACDKNPQNRVPTPIIFGPSGGGSSATPPVDSRYSDALENAAKEAIRLQEIQRRQQEEAFEQKMAELRSRQETQRRQQDDAERHRQGLYDFAIAQNQARLTQNEAVANLGGLAVGFLLDMWNEKEDREFREKEEALDRAAAKRAQQESEEKVRRLAAEEEQTRQEMARLQEEAEREAREAPLRAAEAARKAREEEAARLVREAETNRVASISGRQADESMGLYHNGAPPAAVKSVRELLLKGSRIQSVAFAPGGGWVVVHDGFSFTRMGIPSTLDGVLAECATQGRAVRTVVFTPEGGWALVLKGPAGDQVRGSRLPSTVGSVFDQIDAGRERIPALAFFGDAGWLAVRDPPRANRFTFTDQGAPPDLREALKQFIERGESVSLLAVNGRKSWVIVRGTNGWAGDGLPDGLKEALRSVRAGNGIVRSVALMPEGGWLVIADRQGGS